MGKQIIVNDFELTQFQATGEVNIWCGLPPFDAAISVRDQLADTLGIPRESIIPLGLEDTSPVVGFRLAEAA